MIHRSPDQEDRPALDEAEFARSLGELRPLLRSYVISIYPHPDIAEDIV
jgi:hypothetical protein